MVGYIVIVILGLVVLNFLHNQFLIVRETIRYNKKLKNISGSIKGFDLQTISTSYLRSLEEYKILQNEIEADFNIERKNTPRTTVRDIINVQNQERRAKRKPRVFRPYSGYRRRKRYY